MNIEMQCCGLFMLLVLLVILHREKSLDISRRRMFTATLLAGIACLALDILSVIGIVLASRGTIPRTAALIICKLYLMLLITVGYRGFLYTADEFFAKGTHKTVRDLYRVSFAAGIIAVLLLPIDYYYEDRLVYSYGPSTIVTYAIEFLFLVSTVIMALRSGDNTSRRRKRSIVVWQFSWLLAALLQFLEPTLLVVGFAAAFGIVLVYAELENPGEGIDRVTGQFTANAMNTYLVDLYQRDADFSAMLVHVDYSAGNFDLELEKSAMRRIANFLDEKKGAYVFRQTNDDFVVIYKDRDSLDPEYNRAVAGLQKAAGMPVKIRYTLIPDGKVLKSADEFLQFGHYIESRSASSEDKVVDAAQAEEMRRYLKVRDQISYALSNHKVEVFYQPIYNIAKHKFTNAEALVRIRDAEGNLVMPGQFIPVAEENGMIAPLGEEVFRQVCELLATGEPQKFGIDFIGVNLSMAQFNGDNPSRFVESVMNEYKIKPDWITLEITETADASTKQAVIQNMKTLTDKGIRFALDDFGTGRSNLDYFVAMPVSFIKFDYTFTHWYFENSKARTVMEGIVDIIKSMQLPIVAEGVETKEQLDAMSKLGASYIQGYYFSKPIPKDELLSFLKENSQ